MEQGADDGLQPRRGPLPRYVERAFRAYLMCGVFAHGFLGLHCDACHRDLLVAFTCQGRGVCPRRRAARKILENLGLPADPTSPRSRARDPDDPASWMDGAAEYSLALPVP